MSRAIMTARVALAVLVLVLPWGAGAQQRVEAPEKEPQTTGLLLPAVQKLAEPAPPPPDKASPRMPARPAVGGKPLSVEQMMAKLRPASSHRRIAPITIQKSSTESSRPSSVQTGPDGPSEYEIGDCGTAAGPKVCCHGAGGESASCNTFKTLCTNEGGNATGDGKWATCSGW